MHENLIRIGGHLAADPKYTVTPKGAKVVSFTVGYNPPGRDTKPCFVDCELWGSRAESYAQRFQKGSAIYVQGALEMDTFPDKNDEKYERRKLKVKVGIAQRAGVTNPNVMVVMLSGNVVKKPELGQDGSGNPIATVTIAHNPMPYTTADKREVQGETIFIDCTVYGADAENSAKYLDKGNPVMVMGTLYQRSWTPRGTDKKIWEHRLSATMIRFFQKESAAPSEGRETEGSSRETSAPRASAPAPRAQRELAGAGSRPAPAPQENLDEDVPF